MTAIFLDHWVPGTYGPLGAWHLRTLRTIIEDAKRAVEEFVSHYNDHRLHSAIGYVTPSDMLEGRQTIIHAERDRKLEQAREERARKRAELRNVS